MVVVIVEVDKRDCKLFLVIVEKLWVWKDIVLSLVWVVIYGMVERRMDWGISGKF